MYDMDSDEAYGTTPNWRKPAYWVAAALLILLVVYGG